MLSYKTIEPHTLERFYLGATLLWCQLLLWTIPAMAQQNYYAYHNVALGQNPASVLCFVQDADGMVWIGSDRGLYSYDGYAVYPHFVSGTLANTRINCGVLMDGSTIYLGTDNGLLAYNYRTDRYYKVLRGGPSDVRALARDGNSVWIGTLSGLYRYDMNRRRYYRFDAKRYPGLPHNTIYSIIRAKDGRMYFGTYNGLCYFDARSNSFRTVPLPQLLQKNNVFVNALLEDPSRHCMWIGTEGELYRYDPVKGKATAIDAFRGNSIKVLNLDKSNRLLIGTDDGLHVYNEEEGDRLILHDARNITSLANDIVWSIFVDGDYNVWIGTDSDLSINAYSQLGREVPIWQITGRGEGNQFYSIYKDYRGRIWMGGSNGLIQTTPSLTQSARTLWFKVKDRLHHLTHNRIRKITEDRDHQLWIATDGGVLRYDEVRKQWVHYNIVDRSHTLNANWAYDLFEDEKGRMWVASCLGGIFVVDKHKLERSRNYCEADYNFNKSQGLAGMFVKQIEPDARGNVWVLLYNNVVQKIHTASMKVTTVRTVTAEDVNNANYIHVDKQDQVWIAYRGGVLCLLPNTPTPLRISFAGTRQAVTLSMVEMEKDIWISTTEGIWVVSKQSGRALHVGNARQSYTALGYDTASDMLYMGYKDGVFITRPKIFRTDHNKYAIRLTAVTVNNELWTSQGDASVRYARTLYFESSQSHIDFAFSDLPYSQDEKGKFVYMLKGVDNDWNILPANSNHVSFDNLSAGNYVLLISRMNLNEGRKADTLAVRFVVLPPWYYNHWAKSFYALAALLLLFWIVNFFRVKSRLKLERLEKQQIIEQTKLKLDFFANISHDFKAPLSMIIAPISRMLLEAGNAGIRKQLELVQRNAMKINALIHQIIDFDRIDNNARASLLLSKVDLVDFVRHIFVGYQEGAFREKGITGIFTVPLSRVHIYIDIDAMKMESAIDNILNNAAKYTSQGGDVHLDLRCEEGRVVLSIADTGIGIPQKDLPYVSQRFFQSSKTVGKKEGTGIGLYLARSYTELHGGTFAVASQEGKGTIITLSLPYDEKEREEVAVPSDTAKPLALIVDDSEDTTTFIDHILQPYFRCKVAHDGKEGLRMSGEEVPDLIISDMMMPVMDGMEMCQQIRKNIPTSLVPIIMLTAKDDKQVEIESIRLNIDVFLLKPFDANVLLMRARQLIDRHNLEEKKERIDHIATPKEIVAQSQDEKFLQQVTQCIEDRIDDFDLNVNALGEQMNLGNKMIYRKLKQLTGMSPVDYIKSIRMKKAAMLLKQQKFTVAEVMYMVGFSNSSYFSKCFQSAFGSTPRQYMEAEK